MIFLEIFVVGLKQKISPKDKSLEIFSFNPSKIFFGNVGSGFFSSFSKNGFSSPKKISTTNKLLKIFLFKPDRSKIFFENVGVRIFSQLFSKIFWKISLFYLFFLFGRVGYIAPYCAVC